MIERKNELIRSQAHWAATYDELHEEIKAQVPAGHKILEVRTEKLMTIAQVTHRIKQSEVYMQIKVPLTYALSFEVVQLLAVPNLKRKTTIKVSDDFLLLNEIQGTYAYHE